MLVPGANDKLTHDITSRQSRRSGDNQGFKVTVCVSENLKLFLRSINKIIKIVSGGKKSNKDWGDGL